MQVLNQTECNSEPDLYCSVDKNNTCFYDYGSGLAYAKENVWYLYGVSVNNSVSSKCNSSDRIYHTIIPKYIDWIRQNMVKNKTDPELLFTKEPDFNCGKPEIEPKLNDDINGRVINGVASIPNSWPWTVAIWSQKVGKLQYECGGSIISNRFILTAAHCVYPKKSIPKYLVSTGTVKLTYFENYFNMHEIKRVIRNKLYDSWTHRHDIALLELEKPLKFNRKVSKVCLPLTSEISTIFNKTVYVAGW